MEYSTHIFLQQTPITEQSFESKLQDISDQITTNGCISSNVFSPFTNLAVQQAIVSSRHIAFLLQDGRICRVSFRIQTDKIDSMMNETTKIKTKHLSRSQSRQSLHRPNFENLVLSSSSNSTGQIDLLPGYPLSRQRHQLIRTARGRTGIILGSRPLIPASSVSEELIEQVHVVLQGKSRNVIIRELQRTNLDVNMAVNNLLARDDDDDDDDDLDDEYVEADLISLLDVNSHNEHSGIILESELFDDADFALRYSNIQRRIISARLDETTSTISSNDRKRHRYDPRWLDGSLREELFGRIDRELKPDDLSLVKDSTIKSNRKDQYQHQHSAPAAITTTTTNSSLSSQNPIIFSDQLQFWTDSNSDNTYLYFTHIACLHSELIAINNHGQLCQWNWHDDYPYQDFDNPEIKHPKTLNLKLFNEKIINLSANLIRATILTETNRLATWIDDSLGIQANLKFQHSLQEFSSLHILDIKTSPLYTIFRTNTNELYWYGLLPHKPRQKLLEHLKTKTYQKQRTNFQQENFTIGCSVCLISNPYYHPGAWAFYIHDGQIKLGQLMEQAWILTNKARFCLKNLEIFSNKMKDDDKSSLEMPPPPSPASSTCSIDSQTSFVSTLKRKKHGSNLFLPITNENESIEQHSKIKDEEYWPLNEVIFIEDCKVTTIGKVMKIDGSHVLVKFPGKTNDNNDFDNLDHCRILRKDDLQIIKGTQIPKTPDCTLSLSNAKRISLENGTLITYSVDKDYLYTLQIRDSSIYYIVYEIGSNNGLCRSIRSNKLPLINNRQTLLSFLGGNNSNSIYFNSLDIPRFIIDGNQLIYPLIFNHDNTNLKEPQWKNFLKINTFSQGMLPLKISEKNSLILNFLQIEKGLLIPHILRYDIDKIISILNNIEINKNDYLLKLILNEKFDGYRNMIHACIQIGIPLTNNNLIHREQLINQSLDINSYSLKTHFSIWSSCKYTEYEKHQRALKILRLLLDYSLFQEHLYTLLNFHNYEGQTPFMYAIHLRAYPSAIILFEYILKISNYQTSLYLPMITTNNTDLSPLFILCTNDTCSFTWTGDEHINQAIFECKTCGLSDTLCCCSECAQICHKGHDCHLKQTSPTAYCDCWEICQCKTLIAGDQEKRFELLKLLLKYTNLVQLKYFQYDNILLYLVQTVGRQCLEQQQFSRTSKKLREQFLTKKLINTRDFNSNIPDHHLEPPQFCRRALELILADWSAVKCMLLCGCSEDLNSIINKTKSTSSLLMSNYNNENIFSINEQQQTSQLDRFTYLLLVKCNTIKSTIDLVDTLLNTLTHEISNPINHNIAQYVTTRFIRSVIRLFIILNLQIPSDKSSKHLIINSLQLTNIQTILYQCKHIFQTLTIISIDTLVYMADLLFAPVRYGIAKPIGLFNHLSSHKDILQNLDEIFNIDSVYTRNTLNLNHINEYQISSIQENFIMNLNDNENEIELELLIESDSDNESNHSISNRNRNQTSTIIENENLVLFSDDENSDSDDADNVLDEDDEINQSESMIFDEARDTLATTTTTTAIASTTTTTTTANDQLTLESSINNNSTGSNVLRLTTRTPMTDSIFNDNHLRRQIPPVNINQSTSSQPIQQQQSNILSINTTNSLLARAFGILIRQITDLLVRLPLTSENNSIISSEQTLHNNIEQCLLPTWQWFTTVMDSLESQIRFGMTLSNLKYQEHDTTLYGNHFLKNLLEHVEIEKKKNSIINNRLNFLNYSLSLMRSQNEHGDQEPLIDILSYKHLAYLFDSFIYYFREFSINKINNNRQEKDIHNEESFEQITSKNKFFQRSSSTLCLSSLEPDPFQITIDQSLPLACRPQLLQPIYRKEDLFGRFLYENIAEKYSQLSSQLSLSNRQDSIRNYLNQINKEDLTTNLISIDKSNQLNSFIQHGSYEYLLVRWRFSIELFVKLFFDDVGNEPGSIINELSEFSFREQRFRHDMERLKNLHQKDIRFEFIERDRILLIQKTFRILNTYYYRNQNINSPPLAVQRIKVTFKDEPGEGTGVARSFYTLIAEAILSEEKLPILELGPYGISSTIQTQRQSRDRHSTTIFLSSDARPFKLNLSSSSIIEHWTPNKIKLGLNLYPKILAIQPLYAEKITGMLLEGLTISYLQRLIHFQEELKLKINEAMNILTISNEIIIPILNIKHSLYDKELNEYTPLFWQPDKKGFYAPRPGKQTPERLNAYRNIGRLMGLCLLQNELFPLPLCRHVIKYILHRSIRWHDLAFFDSIMYENLRRTAYDAEKHGSQYVNDLQLTFSMTVTEKEGGETYDLIPDGSTKDVTLSNLYEFIKRYAEFRMIHLVEQSLEYLRLGIYDVLPLSTFDYLTPEDFRLLLNGINNININILMTYTTFNDESGEINQRIHQFKKWFWSVLEKFNSIERHDLIYFWTGSPSLPASEGGFQPQPSVTIRPADDQHLPTANTCISRLYIPLYSSKTILKFKLQYAIKTKMFGFV